MVRSIPNLLFLLAATTWFAIPLFAEEEQPVQLRMEPNLVTVRADWDPETEPVASQTVYLLSKGQEVVGQDMLYQSQGKETLLEVARATGLGFNEITLANVGVDIWYPPTGTMIRLPTRFVLPPVTIQPKDGLLVNLPEMRLYYRRGVKVWSMPIGIGREGFESPIASSSVIGKKENPTWVVPKSILEEEPDHEKVVPPGPDNPLGTHAIYLGLEGYRIHGTNAPYAIGRRASRGCIRLYPEDIIRLYGHVQVGDRVEFANIPAKAGWQGDELLLEVHPLLDTDTTAAPLVKTAEEAVNKALERRKKVQVEVDWDLVRQLANRVDGIPHVVGKVVLPTEPVAEESKEPTQATPAAKAVPGKEPPPPAKTAPVAAPAPATP